jgi:beta-glucosidase
VDVLFGDYNPSGKLAMTFPRNIGQVPIYYNAKNTGRPFDANQKYTTKYLDSPNTPLYPFGYGLSYSEITYSNIQLDNSSMGVDDVIKSSVTLTNGGKLAAQETVQLYIRDLIGSITRPVKELKGFEKVFLNPGESKQVTFEIREKDLRFYNSKLEFVSEAGEFEIMIGPNSNDVQSQKLIFNK